MIIRIKTLVVYKTNAVNRFLNFEKLEIKTIHANVRKIGCQTWLGIVNTSSTSKISLQFSIKFFTKPVQTDCVFNFSNNKKKYLVSRTIINISYRVVHMKQFTRSSRRSLIFTINFTKKKKPIVLFPKIRVVLLAFSVQFVRNVDRRSYKTHDTTTNNRSTVKCRNSCRWSS